MKAESFSGKMVTNNVSRLLKGNISISPNPARTFIEVIIREAVSDPRKIRIFDLDGAMLFEAELNALSEKNKITLALKPGFYVSTVYSSAGILHTQKLIIVRE